MTYKPVYCPRCGAMLFDAEEVADLVQRRGISKSEVDCPYCGFRWIVVIISDNDQWAIGLVEEVERKNE